MHEHELRADVLVYLFAHRFGQEWVERKVDPVFGRVPADARARVAPLTGDVVGEKSLGEAIVYATLVELLLRGDAEGSVVYEKGWNFDPYDRAYLKRLRPLTGSPLLETMESVIDRAGLTPWARGRRRFAERGISVDQLCAGLRRVRWLRADPYQFVCATAERHAVDLGYYRRERTHIAGPILGTVALPDLERIAEREFAVHRLEREIERFEGEQPELAAAVRDNVERSMLKTRSDEEYSRDRYGDENPIGGLLQAAEDDDTLSLPRPENKD